MLSVGKGNQMGSLANLTPKEQADEERRECLATIAELAAALDTVRTYMDRQSDEERAILIASREWQMVVSLSSTIIKNK